MSPARALLALAAMAATLATLTSACDGEPPHEHEFVRDAALDEAQLTSAPGDTKSHENGANCMACHSAASDSAETAGPGLFTVAASLWSGTPDDLAPLVEGASIQLRTEAFGGGDLIAEYPVDANGNVYTTDAIDFFGAPVFPHVVRGDNVISMPFPTNSGACNLCHHVGGIELIP